MSLLLSSDFLPLGVAIAFFILASAFLFILLPSVQKKRSKKLLEVLKGTFSYPLGTIKFNYKGREFFIKRIGQGKGYGSSGAYVIIYTEIPATPKTVIGNLESNKYYMGFFPKHFEVVNSILVASNDPAVLNTIRLKIPLTNISPIFEKKFSHVKYEHEWHVEGFRLRKKCLMTYVCLPHEIYTEPKMIFPILDMLMTCIALP